MSYFQCEKELMRKKRARLLEMPPVPGSVTTIVTSNFYQTFISPPDYCRHCFKGVFFTNDQRCDDCNALFQTQYKLMEMYKFLPKELVLTIEPFLEVEFQLFIPKICYYSEPVDNVPICFNSEPVFDIPRLIYNTARINWWWWTLQSNHNRKPRVPSWTSGLDLKLVLLLKS